MSTSEVLAQEKLSQPELGKWAHVLIQELDGALNSIPEFIAKRQLHGEKFRRSFDVGLRHYEVLGRNNFRRIRVWDPENPEGQLFTELVLKTKFKREVDKNDQTNGITDYIRGKISVSRNGHKVKNNREAVESAVQLIKHVSATDDVVVSIDTIGEILQPPDNYEQRD